MCHAPHRRARTSPDRGSSSARSRGSIWRVVRVLSQQFLIADQGHASRVNAPVGGAGGHGRHEAHRLHRSAAKKSQGEVSAAAAFGKIGQRAARRPNCQKRTLGDGLLISRDGASIRRELRSNRARRRALRPVFSASPCGHRVRVRGHRVRHRLQRNRRTGLTATGGNICPAGGVTKSLPNSPSGPRRRSVKGIPRAKLAEKTDSSAVAH